VTDKLAIRQIDDAKRENGSSIQLLHYVLRTMTGFLAHLSWLLTNIAVPILAPLALLPLLKFSLAYREIAGDVLRAALRHGQLLWTVIAMSAAACYELGRALDQPMFANSRAWIWTGLVWHMAFIVVSSIVVVFGAADAERYFDMNVGARLSTAVLLWPSVIATAIVATTFSISHFLLS
jgi:hypothetical protein